MMKIIVISWMMVFMNNHYTYYYLLQWNNDKQFDTSDKGMDELERSPYFYSDKTLSSPARTETTEHKVVDSHN